jgi:heterodisulfide reductase subunit C
VRCPKEIKIADVFYAIKRIAIHEGKAKQHKASILSDSFAKMVNRYGRNSEFRLLIHYFLRADFWGWIKMMPIGWKLFKTGRLPLGVHKIKGLKQIRKIIREVESNNKNGGGR